MKSLILSLSVLFAVSVNGQICDPNTNSLFFDGNTSYVSFDSTNDFNITEKITIEAWIKATAWVPDPLFGTIVSKHGWTQDERGYALRAGGNGQISFVIAGVDDHGNYMGWQELTSDTGLLQLNTWHHVAGTFDKKKLKIYVDGIEVGSLNFHGTIRSSSGYNLRFGRIADDGAPNGRYWQGYIDEVRIWKKNRSKNDLLNNKSVHISPANDLVGYWKLNDGTGNIVSDNSGGNNDGTLHGATWNTYVPFTNGILRPIVTQIGTDLFSSSLINNQWNFNGVPISGETGISITPQMNGEYSVTATNLAVCTATSLPFDIVILGMDESFRNNISVIYNQSEQTLSFHLLDNDDASLTVMDSNGRSVIAAKKISTNDAYNLTSLPAGIYHIFISSKNYTFSKNIFCY